MRGILFALARMAMLFIDDRGFGAAVTLWLGLAAVLLPRLPKGPLWCGGVLFLGLAVILLVGTHRDARRRLDAPSAAVRRA